MICHHCKINEATAARRPLCRFCYIELHKNGELNKYPLMISGNSINKLTKKYGDNIINDLKDIMNSSLRELGDKYGFTRENARQIFKRVFNVDYTIIVRERNRIHKDNAQNELVLKKDPRNKLIKYKKGSNVYKGAVVEETVFNILTSLGYDVKPYMESNSFDLVVNDYKVDIKSCYRSRVTSKAQRIKAFRFVCSKEQKKADFIVCYAEPINKYFVIPGGKFPKGRSLSIPEKESAIWVLSNGGVRMTQNKWYKYLDAWHLLRKSDVKYEFK